MLNWAPWKNVTQNNFINLLKCIKIQFWHQKTTDYFQKRPNALVGITSSVMTLMTGYRHRCHLASYFTLKDGHSCNTRWECPLQQGLNFKYLLEHFRIGQNVHHLWLALMALCLVFDQTHFWKKNTRDMSTYIIPRRWKIMNILRIFHNSFFSSMSFLNSGLLCKEALNQ